MNKDSLAQITEELVACRACRRLVRWREEVAATRKRAFADWTYWGKPVPPFGDPDARLLILGLAPAAHGANRTGRMFTGDESGHWLFRALHRAGFASQPTASHKDDGLTLQDAIITASAHCAPPDNKPTTEELARCSRFLDRVLKTCANVQVVVTLGGLAWNSYLAAVGRMGHAVPRPKPVFGHLHIVQAGLPHVLMGSYHPSQQNTFTGRLTEEMLDAVFTEVRNRLRSP